MTVGLIFYEICGEISNKSYQHSSLTVALLAFEAKLLSVSACFRIPCQSTRYQPMIEREMKEEFCSAL